MGADVRTARPLKVIRTELQEFEELFLQHKDFKSIDLNELILNSDIKHAYGRITIWRKEGVISDKFAHLNELKSELLPCGPPLFRLLVCLI